MNRVDSTPGYTVLETMIFLAVSSLLLVSAALLISGRQQKAEFQQGIRDFESQIQDIANDVSTGYYATNNDFTCNTSSGAHATIDTSGSTARGTNVGCIFIGKVIQFSPAGVAEGDNTFDVYSVVGNKQVQNGTFLQETSNLSEALPTTIRSKFDRNKIPGGIIVKWVRYVRPLPAAPAPPVDVGGLGVFTTFGKVVGGNLQKGTTQVNILPIVSSTLSEDSGPFASHIDALTATTDTNPDSGMTICLESVGTNQHVELTISSNGRKFGTNSVFLSGKCT